MSKRLPLRVFVCLLAAVSAGAPPTVRILPRPVAPAGGEPLAAVTSTLAAVGDTLVHLPEVEAARDASGRSFDFRPFFAAVRPLLARAGIATAVLETNLGGAAGGYTGYPRFNSPDEIAAALKWAGIDLVFTAHNHMLDRGIEGIFDTLACLDRLGLAHVGSAATPDPAARMVLRDVNGIRFAFLAYTASTNGIPVPKEYAWAVNLFDPMFVNADVARARSAGAEIVVCALHHGTEYLRHPDAAQRDMVAHLLRAGVDIVLGSHPHAIQPVEMRRLPAGGGEVRRAFVAYSLGNFVSNQRRRYTDCGLMAVVTAVKEPGRRARVADASWRPLWVHRYRAGGRLRYRVLPVYAPEAAFYADDPLLKREDRRRMDEVWEETAALLAGD